MILDDGQGFAIDTESKPPTLKQEITQLELTQQDLKLKIGREGRTKRRQFLQSQYDHNAVKLKKLKKAESK
jgi:hypothetical protein